MSTIRVREKIDFQQGSAELQANDVFEVAFIRWLLLYLKERREIRYSDAVDGGAYVVGCSTATTERYLKKLTSFTGPLTKVRGQNETWLVREKQQEN